MTEPLLRVAALGIGPYRNSPAALRDEAELGIRELAARGAALVLLPELFALPFYAADEPRRWAHVAEDLAGPTCDWAHRLATETGTAIVFGMALADTAGKPPANAVVLAAPGAAPVVVQRKVHLAPAAGEPFGEADHFTAGPARLDCFDYRGVRFCPLVCYDRRYPECWRSAGRDGADVALVLVGGPTADPPGLFEAELRTHARANALYALAACRYGQEDVAGGPQRHAGETVAFGPDGGALPGDGQAVFLDIDPARLAAAREHNPTHRTLRLNDQAAERAYA
ncbi:carbon-nitrogen hydrolase family protein [Aurantimonas endophytica]|uniref:Putative amidohydrolase n=1 Tax=Aurantimonas endophytica TaxID=1522175 RepID=A0A7W6HBF6_9HYPH|nr:carbon-nitrogen hydrolase family protein [Aurantimonas endophytica]MBB4002037.1 putative amidohydrolase [Aurantimonas endophytica]MCO6402330.1 carbon-nitrogen hydrolase family protein [Aurantimonas endophytica]